MPFHLSDNHPKIDTHKTNFWPLSLRYFPPAAGCQEKQICGPAGPAGEAGGWLGGRNSMGQFQVEKRARTGPAGGLSGSVARDTPRVSVLSFYSLYSCIREI